MISEKFRKAFQFLQSRRWNYINTFRNPTGEKVLKDLSRFCRATESTFHEDERRSLVLQGRHEVWLRIQEHLNLSDEELWELRKPE